MKILYTLAAREDLTHNYLIIAERDFRAADDQEARVRAAVRFLLRNPEMGKRGRVPETRELVVDRTPFIVVYRRRGDQIVILRVLAGRQVKQAPR